MTSRANNLGSHLNRLQAGGESSALRQVALETQGAIGAALIGRPVVRAGVMKSGTEDGSQREVRVGTATREHHVLEQDVPSNSLDSGLNKSGSKQHTISFTRLMFLF